MQFLQSCSPPPQFRGGGIVVSNIELDCENVGKYIGKPREYVSKRFKLCDLGQDPREWPHGDERGTGSRRVLVIIDEAAEWFSPDEGYTSDGIKRFKSYLRNSDKKGADVFLIVQDISLLNKGGRVLAHRHQVCFDGDKFIIPVINFNPFFWLWGTVNFHLWDVTYGACIKKVRIPKTPALLACYRTGALFGASLGAFTGYNAYAQLEELGETVKYRNRDKEFRIFVIVFLFVLVVVNFYYIWSIKNATTL